VEASAAAGLRQLQSPELQAAVARVVAVRASSCS
jgi:hypothetical protein